MNCGVPQKSVLEPFLFLLYISDIPQAFSSTHKYLYADATSIFYQNKNVQGIENVFNLEFANICDWFIDHFILVKIKQNAFFSVEIKTYLSFT